jgi:hypothetical protein
MIVIKYRRKETIYQSQLEDFIGKKKIEIFKSWVPKDYRAMRKRFSRWLPIRSYRWRKKPVNSMNKWIVTTLDSFLPAPPAIKLSKPEYLLRFRKIPRYTKDEHAGGFIPDRDWTIARSMPAFTGFFNHLFELNDFSMLDEIQEALENEGISFKGIAIHDAVVWELLRLQLGFHDYTGIEKMLRFIGGNPLSPLLHDECFLPSAADISHVMTRIPARKLFDFYQERVTEAIDLKIIVPRVLLWDTQFVRSNSNNNKNKITNTYTDPDAGYGRHLGRKLGVGYKVSSLYAYCGSWNRAFPVYFDMFPANKSDNPIFRETLSSYLDKGVGECKMIVADTGAYSLKNLEFCIKKGIFPIIRAKKNLVTHPIMEIRKGYWFNSDYFPPGWGPDDVRYIYKRRPAIEAGQSANNTFYNAKRMNTRGIENATRGRVMIYILDLVRALTAVKIGRPDLISTLTAFSTSREIFSPASLAGTARASGYDVLVSSDLKARQKEPVDKWRRKREERKKSKEKLIG